MNNRQRQFIAERKSYYWSLPFYEGAPVFHDTECQMMVEAELDSVLYQRWLVATELEEALNEFKLVVLEALEPAWKPVRWLVNRYLI